MNTPSTKAMKAIEFFNSGYNCSQSVVCAYCKDFGITHDIGKKLASGFGGGLGSLRRTCGALSGTAILLGLKFGDYDPTDIVAKRNYYQLIKDAEALFSQMFHSSICKELLTEAKAHFSSSPMARTKDYYATRPCAVFVGYACNIFEELSAKHG